MSEDEDTGSGTAVRRLLSAGAWALPVHGVLLTVGTLTHQPDPGSDFTAYAACVTTTSFLLSHLLASVLGAAVGVVGVASVALLAAGPSRAPGRSLLAAALSAAANVVNAALFGVAAFAQPAVGRAHLAGSAEAVRFDDDVYGPELMATAAVGMLLWCAGAVLLGLVLLRCGPGLRLAGAVHAAALPVFFLAGLPGSVLQPVAGALAAVAGVVVARRLPRALARPAAAAPRTGQRQRS
ncbi:hypothetical protein [Kineococcus gypseus]|uniref:hypothetical protein n=1 Tax=Kineococcus gypseus TaxID=1637102 RepID=UPI003D7D88A3